MNKLFLLFLVIQSTHALAFGIPGSGPNNGGTNGGFPGGFGGGGGPGVVHGNHPSNGGSTYTGPNPPTSFGPFGNNNSNVGGFPGGFEGSFNNPHGHGGGYPLHPANNSNGNSDGYSGPSAPTPFGPFGNNKPNNNSFWGQFINPHHGHGGGYPLHPANNSNENSVGYNGTNPFWNHNDHHSSNGFSFLNYINPNLIPASSGTNTTTTTTTTQASNPNYGYGYGYATPNYGYMSPAPMILPTNLFSNMGSSYSQQSQPVYTVRSNPTSVEIDEDADEIENDGSNRKKKKKKRKNKIRNVKDGLSVLDETDMRSPSSENESTEIDDSRRTTDDKPQNSENENSSPNNKNDVNQE